MGVHGQESPADEQTRVNQELRKMFTSPDSLTIDALTDRAQRARRVFLSYATHLVETHLEDRDILEAEQTALRPPEQSHAYRVAEGFAQQSQNDLNARIDSATIKAGSPWESE